MTPKRDRLYTRWAGMIQRCTDSNRKQYHNYGGRGIQVCDDWRYSFANFREWALSHGFSPELQLDRIDNDNGYKPNNCRWSSRTQQARNKSSTRYVTAFGETKSVAAWAEDNRCTSPNSRWLYNRLRKFPPEEAITLTNGWWVDTLTTRVD